MAGKRSAPRRRILYSRVREGREGGETATADAIGRIRGGILWGMVQRCQEDFEIKDNELAKIIGVSDRTLTRVRKSEARLNPVASDRFYRSARILRLAADVFEDLPRAVRWLQREQPGLDGKVPLALLDTEPGAQAVETLLRQLEYSVLP